MKISERLRSPTPPFFRKLRNIGIALAAVGTAIISAPVALPVLLVQVAGYATVAAAVASAVSQAVIAEDKK